MSKESALAHATQQIAPATVAPEARISPVAGIVPEERAKEAANPAVENGGVVPQPLVSTQLTHLAKKEAKLLSEREALRKEREEFDQEKLKVKSVWDRHEAFEATRKVDPIKAMKELGFTEQEIVDYLAKEEAPQLTTEEIVQRELKKAQQEQENKAKEAQKKQDDATIAQFKTSLKEFVSKDPEKYELCHHHGQAAEDIMFEIAVVEAKEGKAPDIESIATDVEEFYMQQFEAMKKLKKLSPKEEAVLAASQQQQPERTRTVHPSQDAIVAAQAKPKATTITNRIAATSAALTKPGARAESRDEKRARLEAMIRANGLKK